MRKTIYIAISTLFISLLLFGCQSQTNVSNETFTYQSVKSDNDPKLSIEDNFRSISISKLKGVGEITIDDAESIQALQNVFSSAIKEPGIVNMADPQFYVKVVYDKGNYESWYGWIGETGERSAFMRTEDTHTIYTVSEEMTDEWIALVKSRL